MRRSMLYRKRKRLMAVALTAAMVFGNCNVPGFNRVSVEASSAVSVSGLDLTKSEDISTLLGTTRTKKDTFDASFLSVSGYASGNVNDRSEYIGTEYYRTVSSETELLAAIDDAAKGKVKVIEITKDMYLGWWELTEEQQKFNCIEPYTGLDSEQSGPLTNPVLLESGVSELAITNVNGLTIFSQNGATIRHAELKIQSSAQDIVIRNLKFAEMWDWPDFKMVSGAMVGDYGKYKKNGWTNIKVNGAKNVWIDHCTFGIAFDGNIDVENAAQGISITWCDIGAEEDVYVENAAGKTVLNPNSMLYKTMTYLEDLYNNDYENCFVIYKCMRDVGITPEQWMNWANYHSKCHLVGSGDKDIDDNKLLQISLAFNKYESIGQRIPLLRGGNGTVTNCYMTNSAHTALYSTLKDKISTATKAVKKIYDQGYVPNTLWRASNARCGASIAADSCYYEEVSAIVGNVVDDDLQIPSDIVLEDNYTAIVDSYIEKGASTFSGSSFDNNGTNLFTAGFNYKYSKGLNFKWTDTQGDALPFNYQVLDVSKTKETVLKYGGYATLDMDAADWLKTSYADTYTAKTEDTAVAVTGIAISCDTSMYIGDRTQVKTVISPVNATNKIVRFETSDAKGDVLTITDSGYIKAVGAGVATVTGITDDGSKTASVTIQVDVPVTKIALSDSQLRIKDIGAFKTLTAVVTPDNATDASYTWKSSDENVATVEDGRVVAKAAGLATITVTSNQNPMIKATCEVAVGADTTFSSTSQAIAQYDFETLTDAAVNAELATTDRTGATGKSLKFTGTDSRVSVVNPYAGMTELCEKPSYDSDGYPDWKSGVTMSYWIKTADQSTASTVLSFKNDKYLSVQKDDIGKYMVCQKFVELYATETDGETVYEEVTDTSSDFYMGTKTIYTSNADGTGTEYTVYSDYGQYMEFSPHYEGYGYKLDEVGTITAYNKLTGEQALISTITKDGNEMGYWSRYGALYDENAGEAQTSVVRYGYTDGLLGISSFNQFTFAQQLNSTTQQNPNHTGSYGTAIELQNENQLAFTPTEKATVSTLAWHYVTVVIKNDDVVFYVDGQKQTYPTISYKNKKGIWANNTCARAFNLGYRMGSQYSTLRSPADNSFLTTTYSNDSKRYAATILEWLTDENTQLFIGGSLVTGGLTGTFFDGVSDTTKMGTVSGTEIDDLTFYATPLSDSEAYALYQENLHGRAESVTMKSEPTNKYVMQGDSVDVAGGKITVSYADGYSEDVDMTSGMVSYDDSTTGETTVYVTYQDLETNFKINVVSRESKLYTDDVTIETLENYETTSAAVSVYFRTLTAQSWEITSAELTGANRNSFELNKTDASAVSSEAVNQEYVVTPKQNLEPGVYTANVVFTYGHGFKTTAKVTFTVIERTYVLNIGSINLGTITEGYTGVSYDIPLTNTGNSEATVTNVQVNGLGKKAFTLNKTTGTVASGVTDNSFKLNVTDGMAVGSYRISITVYYNNTSVSTSSMTLRVQAAPASEAPASKAPASESPVSEAPVSEAPASEAPVSEAPASKAPASEAPASEKPISGVPSSEPSESENPASGVPASAEPTSESPASGAPASAEPQGSTVPDVMLGDVDGDAKVTLSDAQLVLKAALKLTNIPEEKQEAADVNKDGAVNLMDAQQILKYALKLITAFEPAKVKMTGVYGENTEMSVTDLSEMASLWRHGYIR